MLLYQPGLAYFPARTVVITSATGYCCRWVTACRVISSARWQKGLTGYCFKYIDRPFCPWTDDLLCHSVQSVSWPGHLDSSNIQSLPQLCICSRGPAGSQVLGIFTGQKIHYPRGNHTLSTSKHVLFHFEGRGHQLRWLAGGYDLEIGQRLLDMGGMVIWWIVAFLRSDSPILLLRLVC